MPDHSLIFIYGLLTFFLLYLIIKIIKPQKRREEILGGFIFLAFITMIVYVVYSDNIVKNVGISFIAFCTIMLSITTIDHVVANICISKALKKTHHDNNPKIDEIFKIKESYFFSRRSWYVICAPDKSIDIGVNLFKNKPQPNKKFHIKTLDGTCKYVIPDYFSEKLDTMDNYFI
ncbi:hypothetical protein [Gibbsiella quercinecans]|uniref:hypothetical protein n=1 Tax=Gibbsiella quercinecans TaxID=929813 RepID=UPI003A4D459D